MGEFTAYSGFHPIRGCPCPIVRDTGSAGPASARKGASARSEPPVPCARLHEGGDLTDADGPVPPDTPRWARAYVRGRRGRDPAIVTPAEIVQSRGFPITVRPERHRASTGSRQPPIGPLRSSSPAPRERGGRCRSGSHPERSVQGRSRCSGWQSAKRTAILL